MYCRVCILVSIYICSPEASHTYEQVMTCTSMSEVGYVTHMKESCHTYKRGVPNAPEFCSIITDDVLRWIAQQVTNIFKHHMHLCGFTNDTQTYWPRNMS